MLLVSSDSLRSGNDDPTVSILLFKCSVEMMARWMLVSSVNIGHHVYGDNLFVGPLHGTNGPTL